MPIRRRHGLRTVALSAAGSAGPARRLTCLRGRKTVILRPLLGPDGSTDPIERPGELMLAVDHAGRSVAVLRVERAGVAPSPTSTRSGAVRTTRTSRVTPPGRQRGARSGWLPASRSTTTQRLSGSGSTSSEATRDLGDAPRHGRPSVRPVVREAVRPSRDVVRVPPVVGSATAGRRTRVGPREHPGRQPSGRRRSCREDGCLSAPRPAPGCRRAATGECSGCCARRWGSHQWRLVAGYRWAWSRLRHRGPPCDHLLCRTRPSLGAEVPRTTSRARPGAPSTAFARSASC